MDMNTPSAEPQIGERRKAVENPKPEPVRTKQRRDDTKLDEKMGNLCGSGSYTPDSGNMILYAFALLLPEAKIPKSIDELPKDSPQLDDLLQSAWETRKYGALLEFCRKSKLKFPCSLSIHSS